MVSDEVCGYLRHIKSGFCVRVETTNTVSSLIADKMYPSDLDHYFCHSTVDKTMTVRSRSDKTLGTVSFDDTSDVQFIPQARVTNDTIPETWRFKTNGKIRSESKRNIRCWERSADTAKITLAECDGDEQEKEARSHQFGLQLKKDKSGIL